MEGCQYSDKFQLQEREIEARFLAVLTTCLSFVTGLTELCGFQNLGAD